MINSIITAGKAECVRHNIITIESANNNDYTLDQINLILIESDKSLTLEISSLVINNTIEIEILNTAFKGTKFKITNDKDIHRFLSSHKRFASVLITKIIHKYKVG